ncbi:hypothetical protein G7Z17_g11823 [Cylindrodendrum hubeiense]|uniref:Uncharacterized protein n=1 Tax=Cylindrodendrum hubeiense TaxID=595255 RepID=A0A9P5LAX2_9HYPO|nr:hypothetical protein G7Z17_g11823 [Cylindrodendrum hubeiense]
MPGNGQLNSAAPANDTTYLSQRRTNSEIEVPWTGTAAGPFYEHNAVSLKARPVSPIVFLLYTELAYKIRIKPNPYPGFNPVTIIRYDYADITSLHIRDTLRKTTDEAETNIGYWGLCNETKAPEEALRWLGAWLDRKLSFKTHVEQWIRLAIKACVLPILFYATEAWYPRKTIPSLQAGGPQVPTRIDYLLERLKKVLHTSIRSILPT